MKLRIVFVSSYPPRECGIATFTEDLVKSLERINANVQCRIVAIEDKKYRYNRRVKFRINQREKESFLQGANWLNNSGADLVNIQHQFLLYGEEGEFTPIFLKQIKLPIITTIHTLPTRPTKREKEAIKAILSKSKKVTVMINYAQDTLKKIYQASEEKIVVIPHPVPKMEKIDQERAKSELGLKGNIISTFGLIRRDKGIEYAIEALPEILEDHPKTFYLVIGKTHPSHQTKEGERYREELSERAEKVSSGALIYGLSLGRICISTPFSYAKEILSSGRGILVEFHKSSGIAEAVNGILKDEKLRKNMEGKAYRYGRSLLWPKVAANYLSLFRETK